MHGTSFYDGESGFRRHGDGGKWPVFACEDPTHRPELDKFFRHFDDEFKNHESIHYST